MSDAWKKFDLEGAGLQTLNLRLARALRRRPVAYALWLLFPLGAHRFYLGERIGGLAFVVLSAAAAMLAVTLGPYPALAPAAAALLFALYDLAWIDRRVTATNKRVRMDMYLGGGNRPPEGYRGRYRDDAPEGNGELIDDYLKTKETERAGHQPVAGTPAERPRRAPSFNEQEAMLRELRKKRGK